jgi:hypothetical protein
MEKATDIFSRILRDKRNDFTVFFNPQAIAKDKTNNKIKATNFTTHSLFNRFIVVPQKSRTSVKRCPIA